MGIRTSMTEEEIATNMLEIALYLAQKEDVNTIDMKVNDLSMHFECWTDDEVEV